MRDISYWGLELSFNPCCAGCSSGSASVVFVAFYCVKVSILVVLDVVLEVSPAPVIGSKIRCFNPCCAGCSSGSI